MRAPRTQRGFTLIEMMVVVAIIGILSILFIGLSARTYGTSADSVADEVSATLNFAHTRAVSTRRWHCAEVKNQKILLYQSISQGMSQPASACPTAAAWQLVQTLTIGTGTSIAMVDTAADAVAGSASVSIIAGLDSFQLVFKPDGSATGGTVFVYDTTNNRKDRIIVYTTTGNVYSRKLW